MARRNERGKRKLVEGKEFRKSTSSLSVAKCDWLILACFERFWGLEHIAARRKGVVNPAKKRQGLKNLRDS